MGTRSLVKFYNEEDVEIVTLYRQFDGYPTGMGKDLKEIIGNRVLVDGYTDKQVQLNGMNCLAAFVVGALKDGECGNVYLHPAGSIGLGEDYVYTLHKGEQINNKSWAVNITVNSANRDKLLYSGSLADFNPVRCESEDQDE
jgi:hypothetical protein